MHIILNVIFCFVISKLIFWGGVQAFMPTMVHRPKEGLVRSSGGVTSVLTTNGNRDLKIQQSFLLLKIYSRVFEKNLKVISYGKLN